LHMFRETLRLPPSLRPGAHTVWPDGCPHAADRTAKDCLLLPGAGIDLDAAARLAQTAVGNGQGSADFAWFEFAQGLAEYRQGTGKIGLSSIPLGGASRRGKRIRSSGDTFYPRISFGGT
jgi:hypothetical protein